MKHVIGLTFLYVVVMQAAALSSMVVVGNPGNAADTTGFGAVPYTYRISSTEVTNAEYAMFLNAVADTDTYGLYNANMASVYGGITQGGVSPNFMYATVGGRASNPANFVSFNDSLCYANWLHNGQPTGAQGNSTTEDGAYTITAAGNFANNIMRNAEAQFFLTSEDEWYKAAYYDPTTAGYFDYATSSNTVPMAGAPPGGTNSANYNNVVGINTTPVGAYTGSVSPYGTFDQTGNIFEWNEAIISGSFRSLRGGAWGNDGDVLLPAWIRIYDVPAFESRDVGFRVASLSEPTGTVPETSSIAIWVLGLVLTSLWQSGVARRSLRNSSSEIAFSDAEIFHHACTASFASSLPALASSRSAPVVSLSP